MIEALRRADILTTFTISKSGTLNLLEPPGMYMACNGIGLPLPLWVINCVGLQALASWDCRFKSCQGQWRTEGGSTPPSPKFRRYRWSP